MKWKKILVLLLIVILSTALMSPGISAEEETTSQETADKSTFLLYVARSEPEREALHAGSIALALPERFSGGEGAGLLKFTPHTGWTITGPEQGKTQNGRAYLSFGWYCVVGGFYWRTESQ